MTFKQKIIHLGHKIVSHIATRFNCEIHYKQHNYYWAHVPIPDHFHDIYKKYTVGKQSYCSVGQLHVMYQFLSYALNLEGDVAQLGIYKGGSVAQLASLVLNTKKNYYAFDTFEGLPPTTAKDDVNGYTNAEGQMSDTSLGQVSAYLLDYDCVHLIKGYFPESIPNDIYNKKFCFVYLDGDTHQATKDGLKFFWPRMIKGGVIIIDDYGSRRWAGVKRAVEEFTIAGGTPPIQLAGSQCVIIK